MFRAYCVGLSQVIGVLALFGLVVYAGNKSQDFHVFYLAGERYLRSEALYQLNDGWMPFKYHPIWGALMSFFTVLPEMAARWIWAIFSIIAWGVSAHIWADQLRIRIYDGFNFLLLVALSYSCLSAEIGYGQINGFLFLLSSVALLSLKEHQNIWGYFVPAALMVAAASLKLNFGLLLVPLIIVGRTRALVSLVLVLGLLWLLTAVFYISKSSYDLYASWLQVLFGQSQEQFHIFEAQGLFRLVHQQHEVPALILWMTFLLIYLWLGFRLEKLSGNITDRSRTAAFWLTGAILFSPLAWWYQSLFYFPMLFWNYRAASTQRFKFLLYIILLGFALMTFNVVGRDVSNQFKENLGFLALAGCNFLIFLYLSSGSRHHQDIHPLEFVSLATRR